MSTIKLTPGQLAVTLRGHVKRMPAAARRGLQLAAHRSRSYLVQAMPVDTGLLKNAWKVFQHEMGTLAAEVLNSQPYAGIIERGARPHPVSEEGRMALLLWVKRKLGVTDEEEAKAIVESIAWKLARVGQKGKFIVRDALPRFGEWAKQEVARQFDIEAGKVGAP